LNFSIFGRQTKPENQQNKKPRLAVHGISRRKTIDTQCKVATPNEGVATPNEGVATPNEGVATLCVCVPSFSATPL